ncbi:beta strand repeat-containing protein [Glacieibacterium frigidum]|uniref:PEP-CTERM protein-sorting domain-containing protein n=1 Tax=Glacieibacterium frigidum TaxID=2593303 RepID=A0A552UGA7_9SPHN|nr:hypothetical protein [Glacieibacterium frigidum]TRW17262.1 hypothetical protein FMM06_03485 [Glacieibacterium frigidum]
MTKLTIDRVRGVRAAILLGVAALPGAARAADCNWNGSVGGNFATAANWDCGRVPGTTDTAIISTGRADVSSTTSTGSVQIASGAALRQTGGVFTVSALVNNGLIDVTGSLRATTGATVIVSGTGTIVLANAANTVLFNGSASSITLGAGQTVLGSARILANAGILNNQGTIRSTGPREINIDPLGTASGLSGAGVGTNRNAGLYNTGSLIAGTSQMSLAGGLYENSKDATMFADGQNLTMGTNSALTNLSGANLSKGVYASRAGTLTLRTDSGSAFIQSIGTTGTATDTVVRLSGEASQILTGYDVGGASNALEETLSVINASGRLEIVDGREFSLGDNFANRGIVLLGGTAAQVDSSFTTPGTLANSGTIFGHGFIGTSVTNSISGFSGIVRASEGTLTLAGLTGGTGQSDAGAVLAFGTGTYTPRLLVINGALSLGANVVAVTADYQNAGFGSGNSFAARANVTGTGTIEATSATQTLSATGLSGSTLDLGVQRVGAATRTLTITNLGTETTLRGAVQNTNAASVSVTGADFVVAANGGTADATLAYGSVSGDFAGQSLTIANNFDNVADATLTLTGKVTQVSLASLFKAAGFGTLTATGANSYTLDLGSFAAGTQTITTDFGVLNDIALSTFSENLGGSFTGAGGPFSLTGASFAGIDGDMTYTGAQLSFATAGLTAGNYSRTLLLESFSRFLGLDDLALSHMTIDVNATITGGVGTVPEPQVWAQLLAGFAMIGLATRRCRREIVSS